MTKVVVSYRNSTSNHNFAPGDPTAIAVVSYRNSTSNHNITGALGQLFGVVSYRNSTSNHNLLQEFVNCERLYLIEILHQTTTLFLLPLLPHPLYLIEILHQTTTDQAATKHNLGCILSKFYIKPQPLSLFCWRIPSCILSKFYIKPQLYHSAACYCFVVSYRNSTSNHNYMLKPEATLMVVSYRNSTSNHNKRKEKMKINRVVSYRNSTSNHNNL